MRLKSVSVFLLLHSVSIGLLGFLAPTHAQLSLTSPAGGGVQVSSSPDYATDVLQNSWDFDSSADLANYIESADNGTGLTNIAVTGGYLGFTIASADNAQIHLLSPGQCSTNLSGKSGQRYPIDSSKYRYLTIFMETTAGSELRVRWYVGCDYSTNLVRTTATATKTGLNLITIDMQTVGQVQELGTVGEWDDQDVTGLAIEPGYSGDVKIYWATLTEAPPSNNSHSLSYSFASAVGATRYSIFLDENGTPSDGYVKAVALAASATPAINLTSDYLLHGSYSVNGLASSDWATLQGNAWDMNEAADIVSTSGISGGTFSSGTYCGTASSTSPSVLLRNFNTTLSGTDFNHISIRLTVNANSSASGSVVQALNASQSTALATRFFQTTSGTSLYQFDLTASGISGQDVGYIKIQPTDTAGTSFCFDWVSLRANSEFVATLDAPTIQTAPGNLIVNDPPRLNILQPDDKGGADYAATILGNPWNFDDSADVASFSNLTAEIYPNNHVDNLQGDFFHGTSNSSGDPYHPVIEEGLNSSTCIDTSRFRNVWYKLLLETSQDVVNGSVVRLVWNRSTSSVTSFFNGDDTISFDGWNEYVQDMSNIELEPLLHPDAPATPWANASCVRVFRIDPHEFSSEVNHYFDFIRVTADDEADDQFLITYEASDSDDTVDTTISFFYNTTNSSTGGTPIVSGRTLSADPVYAWDTSALAEGTYYVYGVASDGLNTTTRMATGEIVIDRDRDDDTAPTLSLSNPSENGNVYDTMYLKGYALDNIQLARILVYIDGALVHDFSPALFDKTARTANPGLAESSNAGFYESVDISAVADGARTFLIRAYDTNGNITSDTFSVTKQSGADPSPPSAPAEENESPVTVTPPAALKIKVKQDTTKKNTLKITVKKTSGSCDTYGILAGVTSTDLPTLLVDVPTTGKNSLNFTAKGFKTTEQVYLAPACNGVKTGNAKSLRSILTKFTGASKTADLVINKLDSSAKKTK